MKERGIIMSAPEVKALLDGSKAQTRRLMKPQPASVHSVHHTSDRDSFPCLDTKLEGEYWAITYTMGEIENHRCPYGVAGDWLWVRETWKPCFSDGSGTAYRVTHEYVDCKGAWKPSIFMPRNRSRITLEITGVRVERLQDISEEDAKAEGVCQPMEGPWPATTYSILWDSLHGKGAWKLNPWVWVLGLKKL